MISRFLGILNVTFDGTDELIYALYVSAKYICLFSPILIEMGHFQLALEIATHTIA